MRVSRQPICSTYPSISRSGERIQSPTEKGLPIEIYVFSNNTDWIEYEGIQSDIFDHLIASVSEFDLTLFQNPTGNDFKGIK